MIARKRVQVFKSHLDERYAGLYMVSSHDGRSVEAVPVDSATQLAQRIDPMAQVVAIDEAQFLDAGSGSRHRPRIPRAAGDPRRH
jgi:thymidine kinase